MMDLEFPPMSAKTSSSAFTDWNGVAALLATDSASALSPLLPVSMGLVSRWWTTGRASNFDFGFPHPRARDANDLPDERRRHRRTVFFLPCAIAPRPPCQGVKV